jgi:multidrug resistance efflux pump
MALSFSRSLRFLDADQGRGGRAAFWVVGVLGVAWGLWFFGYPIRVLASADAARVEAARIAHRVQAPVSGRVLAIHEELGRLVTEGDVLIELDVSAHERDRDQRRAEQKALVEQIEAIRREIAAGMRALEMQRSATSARVEEARAQHDQAEALAQWGQLESDRNKRLGEAGLASTTDVMRSALEARQQRTSEAALAVARTRVQAEQLVAEGDRVRQLTQLGRDLAELEGKRAALGDAIARLDYEIGLGKIRAPVTGWLGDVVPLGVGAFLKEGESLATVIPQGDLRIVADFPPDVAIGRVRAGQRAHMRLAGFPWTQFGTVSANVHHVAAEVRDGKVRVELSIVRDEASRIPIQHGLLGSLEIEVDEGAPALLVWRAVGRQTGAVNADAP